MRAGILVWEAEQVVSTGFPLQPSCSELPFEPRLSSKSNLPSPQAVPCNNLIMLGIDWYLNCYMNMMTQIWWMRRVSCSHQFLFPVVLKRMNYRILYPSNVSPRGSTLTFNRWAVIIFPTASIASHPDDLTQVTFRIQETTPRLVGQHNRVTCRTCKARNCGGNEHLKNDCDVNPVLFIWTLLYWCNIMSNPEMPASHWKLTQAFSWFWGFSFMARKLPGQADSTLIGAFQCHLGFHRSPIPIIHLDNINIVGVIMILSDIFDKLPGIVPCLLEPSAEQFHPFPQAPPVVSVVVSIKHSFDRKFPS